MPFEMQMEENMTGFVKVNENHIPNLARLASNIWHEYWTELLTDDQINYMVENFQSIDALKKQIDEEHYTYYFITDNDNNIG